MKKPSQTEWTTEAGSRVASCCRLLDCDDQIRGSDEFLEDDGVTWTRIDIQHRWNVGSYWHSALKPMRRVISDN